jgi:hypothetical protein
VIHSTVEDSRLLAERIADGPPREQVASYVAPMLLEVADLLVREAIALSTVAKLLHAQESER